MAYSFSRCIASLVTGFMLVTPGPLLADDTPDAAAAVVLSFNDAVSARDLDKLLSHFAEGGVQFNLRPSHQGLKNESLTSDLKARWSLVGPVLFSATKKYEREADILDSQIRGDIATVWADIDSKTVMAGTNETNEEEFTEFYLLIRTPDGWKIAGVADNRQPNNTMSGGN